MGEVVFAKDVFVFNTRYQERFHIASLYIAKLTFSEWDSVPNEGAFLICCQNYSNFTKAIYFKFLRGEKSILHYNVPHLSKMVGWRFPKIFIVPNNVHLLKLWVIDNINWQSINVSPILGFHRLPEYISVFFIGGNNILGVLGIAISCDTCSLCYFNYYAVLNSTASHSLFSKLQRFVRGLQCVLCKLDRYSSKKECDCTHSRYYNCRYVGSPLPIIISTGSFNFTNVVKKKPIIQIIVICAAQIIFFVVLVSKLEEISFRTKRSKRDKVLDAIKAYCTSCISGLQPGFTVNFNAGTNTYSFHDASVNGNGAGNWYWSISLADDSLITSTLQNPVVSNPPLPVFVFV